MRGTCRASDVGCSTWHAIGTKWRRLQAVRGGYLRRAAGGVSTTVSCVLGRPASRSRHAHRATAREHVVSGSTTTCVCGVISVVSAYALCLLDL